MRSDLIALINTKHLVHNLNALRALCGPAVKVCAVLKANAYGHGMAVVAPALHAADTDYAAVATLQEAIELRSLNWHKPILILGNVLAVMHERERRERVRAIVKHGLTLTITDPDTVAVIAGMNLPAPIDIHVKADTGMGRLGSMPEDFANLVRAVLDAPGLRLAGLFSHFATAESQDQTLAIRQLATFNHLTAQTGDWLPSGLTRHMCNSAATITLPQAHFEMVRPGLVLYGYLPADHLAGQIDLRPTLRLVSHLTAVKDLPEGHCVGYGQSFTTRRRTRLGIVPIGYYDGFLRSLASGVATVAGAGAPIIGRVSMDQLALDLTDLPAPKVGEEVALIEDDPKRPNSVAAIAHRLGVTPYEVICLLGQRIQRLSAGSFRARTLRQEA